MESQLLGYSEREWKVEATIPIIGSFLISFRPAFLPPLAAANALSQSFNSARSVAELAGTETVLLIVA